MGLYNKVGFQKKKNNRIYPISPDIEKSSLSEMYVSTDKYVEISFYRIKIACNERPTAKKHISKFHMCYSITIW